MDLPHFERGPWTGGAYRLAARARLSYMAAAFSGREPEQLTFGPTSQEGVASGPRRQVASLPPVGAEDRTVWLHDKDGDHQISASEGNASSPSFSSDGREALLPHVERANPGRKELWIKDLTGGRSRQGTAR